MGRLTLLEQRDVTRYGARLSRLAELNGAWSGSVPI